MSDAAVVFDGVWKKFRRGERHDSLRDLVPALARRMLGRSGPQDLGDQEFWALKDVSFEVKRGEALGIIGPNGAGKSTTLKLLTRILKPTRGGCRVRGRVGALIEVAAGFHPDLTGRENIYLQGAIMGMRRTEITTKLDAIVDFAGVGEFIDTPVKRYSSGMNARLGFSIAAHLNPDVLFIDEVLSVGDMSFQVKCLDRMREHVRTGVTLVFVSHNLQAVASLCQRALVIAKGELLFEGRPEQAMGAYLSAAQRSSSRYASDRPSFRFVSADLTSRGGLAAVLEPHSPCTLAIELECLRDAQDFSIGVELERTRDLLYCYGTTTEDLGQPLYAARAGERFFVSVDFRTHLARGHYRLNLNVRQPRSASFLFYGESVANFSIAEQQSYDGVAAIEPRISVHQEHGSTAAVCPATVA